MDSAFKYFQLMYILSCTSTYVANHVHCGKTRMIQLCSLSVAVAMVF